MPKTDNLLRLIHGRRLWQVFGIYLAGGWLVLQIVDTLAGALNLPEWAPRLAFFLLIVGLPIVLATAFVQGGVRPTRVDEAAEEGGPDQSPTEGAPEQRQVGRLLNWRNVLAGGVVAFALLGVGTVVSMSVRAFGEPTESTALPALDEDLIVVLPFRVSTSDPSLGYLREGLIDLIEKALTESPRVLDAGTTMSAWRKRVSNDEEDLPAEDALELARELGAGQLLRGSVVGSPDQLTFSGSLTAVRSGETLDVAVQGSQAELATNVEEFVASLLSQGAGERTNRLDELMTRSLPALRAYLEGRAQHRQGAYAEASRSHQRALDLDSTFAYPAMYMQLSLGMTLTPPAGVDPARANRLLWAYQDRLTAEDQEFIGIFFSPPESLSLPYATRLAMREAALDRFSDRPEAWYMYGDYLYHYGQRIDIEDAPSRALAAFERYIDLDPRSNNAWLHAWWAHLVLGQQVAADAAADQVIATGGGHVTVFPASVYQYRAAYGDSASQAWVDEHWDELEADAMFFYPEAASYGAPTPTMDQIDAAMDRLLELGATSSQRRIARQRRHHVYRNAGRRGQADLELAAFADATRVRWLSAWWQLLDGLYWDGDPAAADEASVELRALATSGEWRGAVPPDTAHQAIALLSLWSLHRGALGQAQTERDQLAEASDSDLTPLDQLRRGIWVQLLDARLAQARGEADAQRRAAVLDSIVATGPRVGRVALNVMAIELGRLFEALGDTTRALRAIRRQEWGPYTAVFESTQSRMEGRLADAIGDADGAIDAYGRFLALRFDPDPELRPEVDAIRNRLGELVAAR
ncbi:MAG: hypothetical protein ACC682_16255 [Gemmatimonadota bacterium]